MVGIMRVPRGWGDSFGITSCSGGSPAAGPRVTLGEARGWGLRSLQEVGMHQVSALGASQGVFYQHPGALALPSGRGSQAVPG